MRATIRVVSPRAQGILEVVVSGICFGFLGFFGRAAFGNGLSPGELLSLRFLISASILVVIFSAKYLVKGVWEPKLPARKLYTCLALGVFGYAVFSSCFFAALYYISASLTVLLLYLYPCFVAIASHFLLNEKLSSKGVYALIVSTLGLLLVVGSEWGATNLKGILLGLLSAFFYAGYILYSRKTLKQVSSWTSVFYIQVGAGVVLALINFRSFERVQAVVTSAWPLLLAVAVLSTLIAMALFLSGLRKLSSTEVSILSNTEPLTGLIVAALLMNETLTTPQYFGGGLVLLGLSLLAR